MGGIPVLTNRQL